MTQIPYPIIHMPDKLTPRRLILLAGTQAWGEKTALDLINRSGLRSEQTLYLTPGDNALRFLGQERSLVVIDTYHGLNPDVFGRVSGLVQAGGALLLCCPALEDWPDYHDPEYLKLAPYPQQAETIKGLYLKRWVRLLSSLNGIECYTDAIQTAIPVLKACPPDAAHSQACTPDQQHAIDAVLSVVQGQRRRPAIISADRGRGKSAALGLAAGQLLATQQVQSIILTASSMSQVGSVFKHAHAVLPDSILHARQKGLQHPHGSIRYIAADALIAKQHECGLLIVDEASTLGVARLEALLKHYPRIAFSGTEQGYEGSGRGFSLKFRQLIQAHCRGQHAIKLDTPVRWATNDPLENWTNRLLLLDSEQSQGETQQHVKTDELSFREIEQSQLAEDDALLNKIMGLLVSAHYQTRPADVRHLLDAPNSRLFIAEHSKQVVGLVWLMLEGGLEIDIAREIAAGYRRPQGHLVPQVLAAHLGLEDAIVLRCARIQRIAVNPQLQGQGIGSWMLAQIEKQMAKNTDYLASSFGADPPLSHFWQRAGYHIARVSDKPQTASGLHSVVMLKPCSPAARSLGLKVQSLFREQFVNQLADSLRYFPPDLATSLANHGISKLSLNLDELKSAVLFAWTHRPYESSLPALTKIGRYALLNTATGIEPDGLAYQLLIKRTLQKKPWSKCCHELGIVGQSECVKQLRHGVRRILAYAGPSEEIALLRAQFNA
jgi:tRNA(Met) cytidine acetyltransferase